MTKNLILNTDSYKVSHYLQYPPGTEYVSSYIEARGGDYEFTEFFGLQYFLKEYLSKRITIEDIDEAQEFWTKHGEPFNRKGWIRILMEHDGFLPIKIQAVKEGSIIPTKNVLVQVVNTDPLLPWVTSYIETALLRAIWYPTTVATRSRYIKEIIRGYLERTAMDVAGNLPFKLHDFGARGVSSFESAGIGGAAHLVNFMGTDTMSGILFADKYYNSGVCAYSIPASEHSTITSWGRENEGLAYKNMLDKFGGPGKIVACVSDSYNIYNAVEKLWGEELKDQVINNGATLVVRPDSGDPTIVPMEIIEILGEKFGYTINEKGYRVLPPYVRVIQGDGINEDSIKTCLKNIVSVGWSAENIAFGMGGELLQTENRDTQKWAMKASAIFVDGQWRDVYKSPVHDTGKASKAGRLALVKEDTKYTTIREENLGDQENLLDEVWNTGRLLHEQTFEEIRNLAEKEVDMVR